MTSRAAAPLFACLVAALLLNVIARAGSPAPDPGRAATAPASPSVSAPSPAGDESAASESSAGALMARSDQPLAISSDEMEVFQNDGSRRFVFLRNVRVTRDDVTLESDRLVAFYPAGASQPHRLVATGSVVVTQRERRATCDEAIYHRSPERVVCRGSAELRDGCNRVRGSEIEIDLVGERMLVNGAASAVLYTDAGSDPACQEAGR